MLMSFGGMEVAEADVHPQCNSGSAGKVCSEPLGT